MSKPRGILVWIQIALAIWKLFKLIGTPVTAANKRFTRWRKRRWTR